MTDSQSHVPFGVFSARKFYLIFCRERIVNVSEVKMVRQNRELVMT
jgi:hypothetical protein